MSPRDEVLDALVRATLEGWAREAREKLPPLPKDADPIVRLARDEVAFLVAAAARIALAGVDAMRPDLQDARATSMAGTIASETLARAEAAAVELTRYQVPDRQEAPRRGR